MSHLALSDFFESMRARMLKALRVAWPKAITMNYWVSACRAPSGVSDFLRAFTRRLNTLMRFFRNCAYGPIFTGAYLRPWVCAFSHRPNRDICDARFVAY